MAYILNTAEDVEHMLATIGLTSLDELFHSIPEQIRLSRPLDIPPAMSEWDLTRHLSQLSQRNINAETTPCFLGGGAYDHFIPALVDQLAGRGEFYTAYTPYQAEASQGTLQAIYEYQTLIANLTGLEISNASLYEGGSAVAEAVLMAQAVTDRTRRVVLAETLHPEYRQVVQTYLANLDTEIVLAPARGGRVDPAELAQLVNDETAAIVIQNPNALGQVESLAALTAVARRRGALAIVSVDPISLGLLKRPGDVGADIVVAEGQSLGNPLVYGGPYLGILACRQEFARKLPGRIVGETIDSQGRRCWVLTLQTREQHIRREKATSNICTNQGLFALRASMYLASLGPDGLRRVALTCARNAHAAAERLARVPGVVLVTSGPFFKEFVIRCPGRDPRLVLERVLERGYLGGLPARGWASGLDDAILIAVTEKRTEAEIEGLALAYEAALSTP